MVRSASTTPSLIDNEPTTLRWTLSREEWDALVADSASEPHSLSIAVTSTLRAAAWSDENGILPATTAPLRTSADHPAELREPLSSLTTWLTTLPPSTPRTTTLFTAPALSALATAGTPRAGRVVVVAGFQALPFAEPATGLVYARARWYDPSTGSFLSPDPKGYIDSSNLYAFAGGDPVNRRDPTGTDAVDDRVKAYTAWYVTQIDAFTVQEEGLDAEYKLAFRRGDPDAFRFLHEQDIVKIRRDNFGGLPGNVETYLRFEVGRGNTAALSMPFEQLYLAASEDEAVAKVGIAAAGVAMAYRGGLAPARVRNARSQPTTPAPSPAPEPVRQRVGRANPIREQGPFVVTPKGIATSAQGSVGRVATPRGASFGTTTFGNQIQEPIVAWLRARYPKTQFEFRIRPGQTGVDVEWVGGDNPGFTYADIKPRSKSSYSKYNRQVERWDLPRSETKAITYDADGNLWIEW